MGRTWARGAWCNLDNRAIEKGCGLVHLAAISCPGREELASDEYELLLDERAKVLTCLWCAAIWVTS